MFRKSVVALCVAGGLCAFPAQAVNLLDLSKWDVYGTATSNQGTLTFGDTVGYDTADTDKDGNPSNTWSTGSPGGNQGGDYDLAVSKDVFAQPATLAFTGCISSTAYGYHFFGLAPANSRFTGQPNSKEDVVDMNNDAGFTTRWESTQELHMTTTVVGKETQVTVAGTQPSNGNYCGDYRIEWHDNVADYYFNNAKVGSQPLAYSGAMKVLTRNFEKPFSVTAINFASAAAAGTCDTTTPYNQGYAAAQAACKANPSACGITVSTSPTTTSGHATYNPTANTVHLPFLDVPTIFGGASSVYEIDLAVMPNTNPLQLKLQNAKQVQ